MAIIDLILKVEVQRPGQERCVIELPVGTEVRNIYPSIHRDNGEVWAVLEFRDWTDRAWRRATMLGGLIRINPKSIPGL